MKNLKTGLLWYDENPNTTLEEKVQRATVHYRKKHGQQPNLCYINSTDWPADAGDDLSILGVQVYPRHNILKHHLWIGVAEGER